MRCGVVNAIERDAGSLGTKKLRPRGIGLEARLQDFGRAVERGGGEVIDITARGFALGWVSSE